jgi:predicted DNA-binding transcriptional regulator AlpA
MKLKTASKDGREVRIDMAANHGSPLLKQKEVAELIGMSEAWLEQQRHMKKGPSFIKIGRAVRYEMQVIISFIEERRR